MGRAHLRRLSAYNIEPMRQKLLSIDDKSDSIMRHTTIIMDLATTTTSTIADVHQLIHTKDVAQATHLDVIDRRLEANTKQLSAVFLTANDTLSLMRLLGARISSSVSALSSLLGDIMRLVQRSVSRLWVLAMLHLTTMSDFSAARARFLHKSDLEREYICCDLLAQLMGSLLAKRFLTSRLK